MVFKEERGSSIGGVIATTTVIAAAILFIVIVVISITRNTAIVWRLRCYYQQVILTIIEKSI